MRDGHAETCRKYNLSPSLLRKWRLKYLSKGREGLKDSYPRVDPQLRALEEENERLNGTAHAANCSKTGFRIGTAVADHSRASC
ncbi:transposase [Spirosoma aureum]|uniref:transposase n=1 Tax=Spirosoma aureum TaxID=2692134 RepID=UPI001E2DB478|nr:transposase [Spirosoma aureum]